jgi:CheY-like chemotaxis protein
VDDEGTIRKLVCSILCKEGHKCLDAANGLEAVALFKANASIIDLVVTDLRMPVMGGAEEVARIRETRSDVPIICITGYIDEPAPAGTHLIRKPFQSRNLIAAVKRSLLP